MICCINHTSLQHFGDALVSQYRLRYKLLVDAQYWNLSRFQGMEYDQYDTPASTYLVWKGLNGEVHGSVRVVPTDRPYMIRDIWPDIVGDYPLPNSLSVWEATRFCVNRALPGEMRQRIKHELVLSFLEFGLKNDIQNMIGVMPPKLWDSVFVKSGWDIEFLGKEKDLGKDGIIRAGIMPISLDILENVRKVTGIKHSVLLTAPEMQEDALQQDTMKLQVVAA